MMIKNSKIVTQDLRNVYSVHICLIKPGKDSSGKDHYQPIVLLDTGTEVLNKILGNQIQQHYVKRIVHHITCDLSQEQKTVPLFQNQQMYSTLTNSLTKNTQLCQWMQKKHLTKFNIHS